MLLLDSNIVRFWLSLSYTCVFSFYSYMSLLSKLKCLFQTEKCGMGVVAEEDIKQGDFVIEYVGEG